MADRIDPRTGLLLSWHGRTEAALNYALEEIDDPNDAIRFLEAWREGVAFEEWPEFYDWLKVNPS